MANIRTTSWIGESGSEYVYWIYSLGTALNAEPGNYIYALETEPGSYEPIFVGQTNDLSAALNRRWATDHIAGRGELFMHAHSGSNDSSVRLKEQLDIIAKWNPPCNVE